MAAMKELYIERAEMIIDALCDAFDENNDFLLSREDNPEFIANNPEGSTPDLELCKKNFIKASKLYDNDLCGFMDMFGEVAVMIDEDAEGARKTLIDYLYDGEIA